jgi:hypothetical protein
MILRGRQNIRFYLSVPEITSFFTGKGSGGNDSDLRG